jgi:mercuric reductase
MSEHQIELDVRGMTCDACAHHVSNALQGVEGVLQVHVPGWAAGRATLSAQPGVRTEALVDAVKQAGCRATVRTPPELASQPPRTQPGQSSTYDLVVIGTGGAGMGAAIKAAELGQTVCIVEAGVIGGTCVNIGCVPSKTLIRAAGAYYQAGHHPFRGVHSHADGLDWKEIIHQKDHLVRELRQSKYVDVLSSYTDRITLVRGRARLQADGAVALDNGRILTTRGVVIATGARPRVLPIAGIEHVSILDSTSAMSLPEQPHSLLVIGGRAVALELGQTFARLGTQVTILQRSGRLIPDHEPEIAEALANYLRAEGIAIHTGVTPLSIREDGGEKVITATVDGTQREFRAEQVLMAAGRTPNTHDMGLSEAGIALDAGGFIEVDEHMATSRPGIYAAGDVTNRPQLVYVAAAAGGIAAENALNGNARRLNLTVLPDVIFSDPQVATVGLTEAEALAGGYAVKTTSLPLAYVPRALAARDTRGLIKLVAEQGSDRLLGAHVLAAEAGEVIQTAALAVSAGLRYGFTVADLRAMLFPYLTQVEGLKLAAQTFEKDVAQLSCCAG